MLLLSLHLHVGWGFKISWGILCYELGTKGYTAIPALCR